MTDVEQHWIATKDAAEAHVIGCRAFCEVMGVRTARQQRTAQVPTHQHISDNGVSVVAQNADRARRVARRVHYGTGKFRRACLAM